MVAGEAGERTISSDQFFVDLLTTALLPGEILCEIRIQKPRGKFGHAYQKVRHPASGFAVIGIAVNLSFDGGGACESARVGVTGVASKAYRAEQLEAQLMGKQLDPATIDAATALVCEGVDANSDLYASADYRRHLARVYARRAIQEAVSRAA
jgi:carbon-monoxide dehydrogenase medium subunit